MVFKETMKADSVDSKFFKELKERITKDAVQFNSKGLIIGDEAPSISEGISKEDGQSKRHRPVIKGGLASNLLSPKGPIPKFNNLRG